jgi:hypothetical protein
MSPLRIIGYGGLVVLLIAGLLTIYISIGKSDWSGLALGAGALLLIAFLGNYLWLIDRKQRDPHSPATPNQTLLGLLLACLGLFTASVGLDRIMSGNWVAVFVALVGAAILFERAYRVLKRPQR